MEGESKGTWQTTSMHSPTHLSHSSHVGHSSAVIFQISCAFDHGEILSVQQTFVTADTDSL